jgi:hypothetical protein
LMGFLWLPAAICRSLSGSVTNRLRSAGVTGDVEIRTQGMWGQASVPAQVV